MKFIKRVHNEKKMHVSYGCGGFLGHFEGEVRDNFFSCNAGVSVGSILADCSISSCPSIPSNFHQDDFLDVWEHCFQLFHNREWMKKDVCADCDLFRYCEGNSMHLRDDKGELLFCHLKRLHT